MAVQVSLNLNQFIQKYPLLYHKLFFWAGKRGQNNPEGQIQEYLTELVFEAVTDCDQTELLSKWTKVLLPQERNALAKISPIPISDYYLADQWYALQDGEYSVINEPIVHEIHHDGEQQGIITRNRYDCLVLNCDRLLIVDVDISSPQQSEIQDCAGSSQIAVSQKQAIAALQALAEQFPQLGFRVYKTRNGLRYLCTTQPFDPLDSATGRLMQNLYCDPLYARLCQFQATFRARLTPKPWRVQRNKYREQFVYDRMTGLVLPDSSSYAVCHLIDIIGDKNSLPEFEPLIQVHDSYCRVERLDLELA